MTAKPLTKTFDTKCHDLAKYFLEDMPWKQLESHYDLLAASIQETVEQYIDEVENPSFELSDPDTEPFDDSCHKP